jgi:NAD(P)-dependent dehydrogenase (short-subunit alcohol dehydrogenase family)
VKQVAIVTGGASGIGLALGTALVHRGWHVVLADLQDVAAKEHADRLTRHGPGSAVGVYVDVRDADAVARLVESTHAEHGQLDLMVNNAGIGIGGEPDELQLVHWNAIIDTNLRGVIYGCHAAYPLMKQQGFGTILNTASMAGLAPSFGQHAPYGMTKYGVVGLSLNLRAAAKDYGVHVSALCPGWIDTPMLENPWPEGLPVPASYQGGPPVRESLLKAGVKMYPADRLAEDTLEGLARNKAVLVIPREWQRAWFISRLLPGMAQRRAEEFTTRVRQGLLTST